MKRTTAAGSSGGLYVDYQAGIQPGTLLTAEDRNNLQEEICNLIESAGFALDGTDKFQLLRAQIALSKVVGETIMSEIKLVPVTVAGSRSSTNPSNPLYLPIIDRGDADHDVPSTQAPDLVTAYRAHPANVLGSESFTATVAGSVLTFANTTTNNALLAAINNDAFVQRWLSSGQSATYEGSGPDFTNGRCVNVAGTDYPITAVSLGSRTITVSGTPPAGSQTVIFYPYRIAGSTTSVRLHRLSGFVPVAGGDADGIEIAGLRHMDQGQGHKLAISQGGRSGNSAVYGATLRTPAWGQDDATNDSQTVQTNGTMYTDGVNGTPRTGKTTNPRSHSRNVYTWAGRLLT